MDENEDADLFDDFFDDPGRSVNDSTEKEEKRDKEKASKSSPRQSEKKRDRNGSRSDRSNMSSDHDSSTNYSSDSSGNSDTDSRKEKRKTSKSRSRSASSRSAGSSSSDDSFSSKDSRSRSSRKNARESRSRSYSSSSSRSRSRTTTTTDSPSRTSKEKRKSKRRDSYSSVTSSEDGSCSDSKNSGRRSLTPRPKKGVHRQAWDTEEKSSNSRHDRPRSAKKRSSHDKNSGGGASRRPTQKHSDVNSDSDMTDVSPILSPRNGSQNGHGKASGDKYKSGDKCNGSKPPMFKAMPLDRVDSGRNIHDGGDSNALDLNILMKAVSELEKQKRVKSNTRRVMFEPLRSRPKDKSNYTFSNDDTHRIDQENKRLLKQIMKQVHSREERIPKPAVMQVQQATLTASAVNRRREQQRIENENLAFLRRLQKIKPTRGISRNEQLTAYNSTVLHGIPIASLHPNRKGGRSGCSSSASSVAGSLGRTRSMTSIHSTATASSIATNSRQSSRAGSRPTSAKISGRVERPPWSDRW